MIWTGKSYLSITDNQYWHKYWHKSLMADEYLLIISKSCRVYILRLSFLWIIQNSFPTHPPLQSLTYQSWKYLLTKKGYFKSKFTDILNPCRSVPDARRRNSFVLCRHLPFPQVSHLGLAHSTLRSITHHDYRLSQVLPSPCVCALRRRLKEVSLTRRPWPILSRAKVHSLPESLKCFVEYLF